MQEDDGFDIAADGTLWARFVFLLSPDFTIGNDVDELDIFGLFASGTEEIYISIARVDLNNVVLGLRENGS